MAIVYLSTGEERYIADELLATLDYEPLKKRQTRAQIQALRDQRDNFPGMTNTDLVAWAKLNNPQYLAHNQINAQIDRLQLELAQWP